MGPDHSSPAKVALLAVTVVVAVATVFYATGARRNVTGFFRIGDRLPLSPFLSPARTTVFSNQPGYDGQYFLTVALDPLLSNPGSRLALDNARWRYRRILYPALGWLLGCGRPWAIPWALVLLNAGSAVGLVAVLAVSLAKHGASPRLALWSLGFVGVWVALFFSTADLLITLLVTASVAALVQHRPRTSALCLALACLGRETSLVLVPLFWVAAWRRSGLRATAVPLLAVVPWAAWNAFVLWRLPAADGPDAVVHHLAPPFTGLGHAFVSACGSLPSPRGAFGFAALASLVLAAWLALPFRANTGEPLRQIRLVGFGFVALLALSGPSILDYFMGSQRIFLPLFALVVLALPWTRRRSAALWIVLGFQSVCTGALVASRFLLPGP